MALAIVLAAPACSHHVEVEKDNGGPTHVSGPLMVNSQQVWLQNNNAAKYSDAYRKFVHDPGVPEIDIVCMVPADGGPDYSAAGQIINGKLSFSVAEPDSENLLEWDDFSFIFFHEWHLIDGISIDDPGTKGTFITLLSNTGRVLNREGLVVTAFSIGLESIYYVYADRDCEITLDAGSGTWEGYYHFSIDNPCTLYLQEGWNTICKKEAYGKSGNADISMTLKNPNDFKWVLQNFP